MSDATSLPRKTQPTAGQSDRNLRMEAASGQPSRAEARRRKIFRSLHDCIIENGYSKTTLADIAKKAGMSPSHLLYYFQGKERILEEYFDTVAGWFLKRVADIAEEAREVRIRALCDLWFGEGEAAYDDIGFMLECFGEAVHDGEMRHTKSEFDRACKNYLVSLFPDDDASVAVSAEDAAEISYALLIGLRNSVYFDRSMSPGDAARCFSEAVSKLRAV
ncbi:MAG: TetR/AcrR family transcriptional regulator [Pseudomonadota bacterium]